MIFQKPSTRTRVSFEVGMFQLGGTALYLGADDIQLHRGETIADTAKVLSRFVNGIMARVFAHQDLLDLAKHGTVPVINGLSDLLHPVQALADYFTLWERRGSLDGLKMAYIGDGNNVCHELLFGAAKFGMTMAVACPEGYDPNPLIVKSAAREAQKVGAPAPIVTRDPMEAAAGADARLHGRLDVDGPGGGGRGPRPGLPGVHGLARDDGGRRARGRLHALPSGPPGRGGGGRRHRRSAVGRLRRGREPPSRPEGRAHPLVVLSPSPRES